MQRHLQVAVGLAALAAYAGMVCAGYLHARAETANETCGVDCLVQRVDTLNKKTESLEHTVEHLTAQVGKSIKSGQTVTLHTQASAGGGCLTFIGPSGDRGGYVSWNADCSHGTSWMIN
jgi:hypothetical protein